MDQMWKQNQGYPQTAQKCFSGNLEGGTAAEK